MLRRLGGRVSAALQGITMLSSGISTDAPGVCLLRISWFPPCWASSSDRTLHQIHTARVRMALPQNGLHGLGEATGMPHRAGLDWTGLS